MSITNEYKNLRLSRITFQFQIKICRMKFVIISIFLSLSVLLISAAPPKKIALSKEKVFAVYYKKLKQSAQTNAKKTDPTSLSYAMLNTEPACIFGKLNTSPNQAITNEDEQEFNANSDNYKGEALTFLLSLSLCPPGVHAFHYTYANLTAKYANQALKNELGCLKDHLKALDPESTLVTNANRKPVKECENVIFESTKISKGALEDKLISALPEKCKENVRKWKNIQMYTKAVLANGDFTNAVIENELKRHNTRALTGRQYILDCMTK
jgi:hypothetical protein